MTALAAFSDRRAFGRRETHISATARLGGRSFPCIIKDLSEGGALLEFAHAVDLIQPGSRLWLSWPDVAGEVVGEVRHTRGNRVGFQFARLLACAARPTASPVSPSLAPAARPASTPDVQAGGAGSALIAERRRAQRQVSSAPATQAAPTAPVAVVTNDESSTVANTVEAANDDAVPRDASAILASVRAQPVASEAPASRVPMPLPASSYASPAAL